jgi:polysaccharide deacetylase family protein (PEP-CTERM system associated)
VNVFSVDVEDYFHVEAFSDVVDRASWPSYPQRVDANTRRLLDLLDEHQVSATFFILGWVAERHPRLVQEIVRRNHEPACHSYLHRPIFRLDPNSFRRDTLRAKAVIEQAAGTGINGYRAPSFSITADSLWAFDVLAETGFTYDSSVFPIRHDVYGMPQAPRRPFRVETTSGVLLEFPLSTFRVANRWNLPVGGGGYLRILPFWYTRLGAQRVRREELPFIAYVHPWELDPDQPRLSGRIRSRLRHYTNLKATEQRLRKLIQTMEFGSFRDSGWPDVLPTVSFTN